MRSRSSSRLREAGEGACEAERNFSSAVAKGGKRGSNLSLLKESDPDSPPSYATVNKD